DRGRHKIEAGGERASQQLYKHVPAALNYGWLARCLALRQSVDLVPISACAQLWGPARVPRQPNLPCSQRICPVSALVAGLAASQSEGGRGADGATSVFRNWPAHKLGCGRPAGGRAPSRGLLQWRPLDGGLAVAVGSAAEREEGASRHHRPA